MKLGNESRDKWDILVKKITRVIHHTNGEIHGIKSKIDLNEKYLCVIRRTRVVWRYTRRARGGGGYETPVHETRYETW